MHKRESENMQKGEKNNSMGYYEFTSSKFSSLFFCTF